MTFADYLRRRRSYTEAGIALRAALTSIPDTVQTPHQVHAWLLETKSSLLVRNTVQNAVQRYSELLRKQATRAVDQGQALDHGLITGDTA